MWMKRLTFLLAFLMLPGLALASNQTVFANGGALFSDAPAGSSVEGTPTVGQLGGRFELSDLFSFQGAVSYHGLTALEGAVQFHPFETERGLKPYLFAGYGHYVSEGDLNERAVVPVGVGVEYPVLGGLSLNFELANRWTTARTPTAIDVYSGITPTIGVSYDVSSFRLPSFGSGDDDPALPPVADAEPQPEAPVEEGTRGRDAEGVSAGGAAGAAEGAAQGQPVGNPGEARQGNTAGGVGTFAPGEARTSPVAGDTTGVSAVGEMALLPDGTFILGLTDEDPLSLQNSGSKRVTISSFYLDKYEVSNEEYRDFLDEVSPSERQALMPDSSVWEDTNSRADWEEYFRSERYADYPVIGVSQEQATRFCEVKDQRLPTEAEWEYAARAGQVGGIYPWPGFEPRNAAGRYLANYNPGRGGYAADGYAFTAPVDAYPANAWGLYNISGNVAEWTQDAYVPSYSELSDFNPISELPEEERRVVRGGSWASDAFYIGVGVRDMQAKDSASPYVGFRCAMDLTSAERAANGRSGGN